MLAAPRQRDTDDEKKAIKEGRIPPNWKAKPAKLRHKDRDARWTVKFTEAKPRADGSTPPVDLAIPLFGYQNHISIDRRFGFIRRWAATDATAYEGRRLRQGLVDSSNTASGVWADTAYRSVANETFLNKNGFVSYIHRKKPKGHAMPETMRRANNAKSKIRSRVEHVFAEQKDRMGLFIRTIGIVHCDALRLQRMSKSPTSFGLAMAAPTSNAAREHSALGRGSTGRVGNAPEALVGSQSLGAYAV